MKNSIANMIITDVRLAAEFHAKKDATFIQNSRKCWGIVLCHDAQLEFVSKTDRMKADKNTIVVLPEKSRYRWNCEKDGKYSVIEFDADIKSEDIIRFGVMDSGVYYALFKELEYVLMTDNCNKKPAAFKVCYEMICLLLDENRHKNSSAHKREAVSRVIEYICANYQNPVTNADLSKICGLSEPRFRAIFKEITGKSPIAYLDNLKIEKGKEMLHSEYSTVTDIALALGYRDVYDFSRSFKKHTGFSPSEYACKSR